MENKEPIEDLTKASRQWPIFLLASLLTGYPDDDASDDIASFIDEDWVNLGCAEVGQEAWCELFERLTAIAVGGNKAIDEVRSDYIDIFDRGQATNPPYETEYGRQRALQKSNVLADLAGFYNAFGVATGTKQMEMHDHISVELEFYSFLLMKQAKLAELGDQEGYDIVLSARRKFIGEHLGGLAEAIRARPGVQENNHFKPVYTWCAALLKHECESLGVEPQQLARTVEREDETLACGAAACGVA